MNHHDKVEMDVLRVLRCDYPISIYSIASGTGLEVGFIQDVCTSLVRKEEIKASCFETIFEITGKGMQRLGD